MPPRRGSSHVRRPLPSSEIAIARRDGVSRTTPASPPGRTTVPEPTSWSYWLVDPAAAGQVRRAEQRPQPARDVRHRRELERLVGQVGRARALHLVAGRAVDQRLDRDLAHHLAVVQRAQDAALGDLADHRGVDVPAGAGLDHRVQPRRLHDRAHPLLRLGDHDLERLHVLLAQRHPRQVDVQSDAAPAAISDGGRGQPGRAQVLQRRQQPPVEQLERALDQFLAHERVADLDAGPLVGGALVEALRGQHAGAADAVAAGLRAVQHQQVADPGGAG